MTDEEKRDRVEQQAAALLRENLPVGAGFVLITFDESGHMMSTANVKPALRDAITAAIWEHL